MAFCPYQNNVLSDYKFEMSLKNTGHGSPRGRLQMLELLLGFDDLEENVFLRMGFAGERIQRVHRMRNGVSRIAPRYIHPAIRRPYALVLAEGITPSDVAVVV